MADKRVCVCFSRVTERYPGISYVQSEKKQNLFAVNLKTDSFNEMQNTQHHWMTAGGVYVKYGQKAASSWS